MVEIEFLKKANKVLQTNGCAHQVRLGPNGGIELYLGDKETSSLEETVFLSEDVSLNDLLAVSDAITSAYWTGFAAAKKEKLAALNDAAEN